jgi:hypothetical protein
MFDETRDAQCSEAPSGGQSIQYLESPRKPTQREQLMVKKLRLTVQLANVNAALGALDENPQLEKFLEVMARA